MQWIKDPQAKLDYGFDWSAWLQDGETIISQEVTVAEEGITISDVSSADGAVTFWLSGGVHGQWYHINCHIVTSAGREDDRTKSIQVIER